MSNLKVSQLERISGSNIDINDDLIPITDVSQDSSKRSKSITISEITKTAITGSNGFLSMFSGSNKLINSKVSYDRFGDNTTVDSYFTVNKDAVFKKGISLNSPTNLYDCYLILGNDKVLFPSDSGEGLVLTSVHSDDSMLTLKGWNNTTTLTLGEEDISTNKKLIVNGDSRINGSLTVTGMLTAEVYHSEYVTSSIIYSSGSTKFGDTNDDTHEFTGSLYTQGGGTFTDNVNIYSGLRVDDEANIYGQFTAYSYSIFDNQVQCNSDVTITGNTYLNGNIQLNGEATFNNNIFINADILSEVNIQGGLNVSNASIFSNNINVIGDTSFGFDNKSEHIFIGDVNITEGGITVSDTATFTGGIVSNNTNIFNDDVTVNSSLECNGSSTFQSDSQFNSSLTVGGNFQTNGSLIATSTVTGSGFNKFITTSSFNSFTSSINTLSSSFDSRINTHTHTAFNNNITITGSLNVSGSTSTIRGCLNVRGDGTNTIISVQNGAGSQQFGIRNNGIWDVGAGTMDFTNDFSFNSSNIQRFLVKASNGFTAIGNVPPTARLHISGSAGSETLLNVQTNLGSILFVSSSKNVGINTNTPTTNLDVSGSFRVAPNTISSSNQNGTAGQIYWDANFIYVCTANNTWKSASLS